MPSSTETANPPNRQYSKVPAWNRKLHYYLGLYLLFFVWLFAFTGLLLNHSQWKFAQFWDQRRQTTSDHEFTGLDGAGDFARARDLMRQLGIRGEIEWTETRGDASQFNFRVSRPGHIIEIKADLVRKVAQIQQIDLNAWGVMRILHTFTGVRMDDPHNQRDWLMTSLWAWTMDLVAAGLIVMVFSSLYMWYELREKRLLGGISLLLGILICALFCFGLRWIY